VLRICTHRIAIEERSQIGEARRRAAALCGDAGVGESAAGRVGIIVSELATNALLHARGGQILLQRVGTEASPIIEVIAIDSGPGMRDLDRCMADGFSTAGTAGNGLGAVQRQSDLFDAFSHPGRGTVVVARVGKAEHQVAVAAVCLPYPGEQVCGDGWACHSGKDATTIMVVDGLGHGPQAALATEAALAAFDCVATASPASIIALANERMTQTRGGAVAVAQIAHGSATVRYGGIGNISGALIHEGASRGLFSHNGTVGAQIRNLRELEYPCLPGTLLVMHSDGVATRWNLADYPGLVTCHPAVVAAVLYRDFRRSRDDATVLVARVLE